MTKRLLLTIIIICSFLYSHTQTVSFHRIDGTITTLELMSIDSITFSQTVVNDPPNAGFTAHPRNGFFPLEVIFVDISSNNPEVWHWDFGDGNTSNDQYPIHVYDAPGSYSIQLTVTNEFGEDSLMQPDFVNVLVGPDSFYCGISQVSDFDGNIYNTVLINNQCWLKENLRTTHYQNGVPIENITDPMDWINDTSGAYSWYDNDTTWKEYYGALYNGYAVTNENGLCPQGWKVPSDVEFSELVSFLDPDATIYEQIQSEIAGEMLKSTRTAPEDDHPRWNSPNLATDVTGLSILPGGLRWETTGNFQSFGNHARLWTESEVSSGGNVWTRMLVRSLASIIRLPYMKSSGMSVRCIKDETTTAILPSVTTEDVIEITSTTAVTGGNVTDDGGGIVIARGVVWSTENNPTVEDNLGITSDGTGTGEYISSIIGLTPETTYFLKAYAINAAGVAYGEEIEFSTNDIFLCGTSTLSDIDGNIYHSLEIGEQCWMRENLKTTHYRNGEPIDHPGNDNTAWTNNTTGAYAWLQNLIQWKDAFGALYNWHAVNSTNELCPAGWRVPTDAEWTQMANYLMTTYDWPNDPFDPNSLGNKLKNCRQVNSPLGGECNTVQHPRWNSNSLHYGSDDIGFGGLPGSARGTTGGYVMMGVQGSWWTATQSSDPDFAWSRGLYSDLGFLERWPDHKSFGFSVRCIKE